MGMNPDMAHDPDDDLAIYVLDATVDDADRAFEARLLTDPAAAHAEERLRRTVTELAAASVDARTTIGSYETSEPPAALRDRVLTTALARRPASEHLTAATAPELHAIELERTIMLLRSLDDEDWGRLLDPPELRGWTVHDLAAHITSNESLLAANLGHPVEGIPEPDTTNEARTDATLARHRTMTPAETIAELERAIDAVDAAVRDLDDDELARDIDWWGLPTSIRTSLIIRAFETWTHADDIRRATGRPHLPPPAPSLCTMGRTATGWIPLMLLTSGIDLPDRPVRVTLSGPGGGAYDVDLSMDSEVLPAGSLEPAVELSFDLIEFCRAVANRLPAGGLGFHAVGDLELGRQIVAAVPALAAL
jgi:uncharacterized protein (TIGR03083 family)